MATRRKPEPKRSPRRHRKHIPLEIAEAQRSFKGKWIHFEEWIDPSDWKKSEAKRRSPHSGPMKLPPKPWGASGITRTGTGGTVASSDFGKLERAADRQRRRMK